MNNEDFSLEAFLAELFKNEGETCPAGDNCPVHYRLDDYRFHEESNHGAAITYVGNYVVWSDDNNSPDMRDAIRFDLGMIKEFPTMFSTQVLEVGPEGTLSQFLENPGTLEAAKRFEQVHGAPKNFKDAHDMIAEGVRNGTLELKTA